jgi:hypothetical protein
MPPDEVLQHLPQQWVGIFAIVAFIVYILAQVVEKYPIIAKHVPLGKWWHGRQKRRTSRGSWVAEDNQVITALQVQVSTIAADLALVNQRLRVFTAWSVYDARYHHREEIKHAEGGTCLLSKHYDFFEFERLWQADPIAAASL